MNDKEEWGTSTLALAATVKALGAQYVRVDKSNPKSMVFYFTHPSQGDYSGLSEILHLPLRFSFDDVEKDFTNDCIRIEPKKFYAALSDLKSVIHTSKLR